MTVNGCDKRGELLAHACIKAIDDKNALGLSAVETAAELIMVLSFFSLLGSQLGHGATQLGCAVYEVVDQLLLRASFQERPKTSEIRPVPFAAQSDSQASSHSLGGNRSVASVDQPVLVDLIGRDGAHGDDGNALSTKTPADSILHLLGHGNVT